VAKNIHLHPICCEKYWFSGWKISVFDQNHFEKDDPRKWIFPTIYWYDTKLSQVRQQGIAFCYLASGG
jgi:hypothetical protein